MNLPSIIPNRTVAQFPIPAVPRVRCLNCGAVINGILAPVTGAQPHFSFGIAFTCECGGRYLAPTTVEGLPMFNIA